MNWKTIALPSGVRPLHKGWKRMRARARRVAWKLLLACGRPAPLAHELRARGGRGRVLIRKEGILSVVAGDAFLRYARGAGGVARLEREHAGWMRLRDAGLGAILCRSMSVRPLDPGLLLETELLRPITRPEQMARTLPVLQALVSAARPAARRGPPPTIETALGLLRGRDGARALEDAVRAAFSEPLLRGPSHQDIHLRNVMKDREDRSVLIDLKSSVEDQVVALDVLNFVCKYRALRDGRNVIDQALDASERGWRLPGLEPALDLVDLAPGLRGPAFALHVLGRVVRKHGPGREARLARVLGKVERSFTAS